MENKTCYTGNINNLYNISGYKEYPSEGGNSLFYDCKITDCRIKIIGS